MKSENEIIVRCKQPIKIEKPLQCLLPFSHTVGGRNILQTDFVAVFLFSLYFLNALQSDNNGNTVHVLGLTARTKRSLSRAQNIFMPTNINSFVLLVASHQVARSASTDKD